MMQEDNDKKFNNPELARGILESLMQINEELRTTNEMLETQKSEINTQKDEILRKNKDITDSIQYAKKIQLALMTETNLFNDTFNESFVYFKPKDIVSGDFYWYNQLSTPTPSRTAGAGDRGCAR